MRIRQIRPSFALAAGASLVATLFVGMAPASAATPATIKVSVVNHNAGTLKVTGSHFTPGANVVIEFDQDGAFSGDDVQLVAVRADPHGSFHPTEQVFVTASCLVGVFASDPTHNSNVVNLDTTGMGCAGARMRAQGDVPLRGYITVTGTGFTPGSPVELDFSDATTGAFIGSGDTNICGQLLPGRYPPAPAGQIGANGACNGVPVFDSGFCGTGHLIEVNAVDIDTDFVVPPILADPLC